MLYTVKDRRSDYLPSFGVMMDDHDAAVVFTSEAAARAYVADLGTMYRTVELRSHVLLDFLLRLRIEGVKEIMVDPKVVNDPAPVTIPTHEILRGATDCIEAAFVAAVPQSRDSYDRLMTVKCPQCRRTERISEEDTLPLCCGGVMKVASMDSRRMVDTEATLSAE
jgi:hypothetical protein